MENLLSVGSKRDLIKEQNMAKGTRRKHSAVFKAKVALATIAGYKTLAELAQLSERAADVFDKASAADPPVDVKAMHAKIGQLTLENDFLEGALSKVGLLNAKR